MKRRRSSEHGGSTFLEFILVGVPVIFVMFSTFEMARGMWSYHSLAYAVREGTRYAIVHGIDCSTSPNSCTVTIAQIATVIKKAGVGLDPSQLSLTFTPNTGAAISCTMTNCLTNNTQWPPTNANSIGMAVTISANYPFRSGIAFFWPGTRTTGSMPAMNFPASSKDLIQF
jgi:Flp pilus assembly protein TadG